MKRTRVHCRHFRDWCKEQDIKANYCDPDSPWQNGCIESFNSRLRDELLTREVFDSMWEIRFMLEEHRNNYNHYRPHSALSYLTSVELATIWWAEYSVLATKQVDQQTGSKTDTYIANDFFRSDSDHQFHVSRFSASVPQRSTRYLD